MKHLTLLLLAIVTISSCKIGSNEEPNATLIQGNSVPNSRVIKTLTYKDVTSLSLTMKELGIDFNNINYYYTEITRVVRSQYHSEVYKLKNNEYDQQYLYDRKKFYSEARELMQKGSIDYCITTVNLGLIEHNIKRLSELGQPQHLDSIVVFLANKSQIKFIIEHGLN
jgi:hypothetical protein